jgi:hypothetical protein
MQVRTRLAVLSLLLAVAAPLRAQSVSVPDASADSVSVRMTAFAADSIQATSDVTNRTASEPVVAGASMTGLRAGVHLRETSRPSVPTMAPARAGLGQARAMMVVGAAALVAGAIIGGDPGTIVMVGGAVIGLIGLYEYLQ